MRQVATIALLVNAFVVVLSIVGPRLHTSRLRAARIARAAIGVALIAAYAWGVLSHTVFGRHTSPHRTAALELFWSYREALGITSEGLVVTSPALLTEIVLNILLFVPLGAILPFVAPGTYLSRQWGRDVLRVILVSCACSCAIELTQWVFRLGLFEFDDVINNAIGATAGYVVFRLSYRAVRRHQSRHRATNAHD